MTDDASGKVPVTFAKGVLDGEMMGRGLHPELANCRRAVLLLLSSLARYEPARWQRALDVDRAGVAVLLEEVLDLAQTRVPELLFEALTKDLSVARLAADL
jgi:hypothetical protein